MSDSTLLSPLPPIHIERERRRLWKNSRPRPEGRIELVDMTGGYSFRQRWSNDERLATTISDVFSVYEYRHHHILEPTSSLLNPVFSAPMTTASGSTTTPPTASTGCGATLMNRIGSVKKWGVRRRRVVGKGELRVDERRSDLDRGDSDTG